MADNRSLIDLVQELLRSSILYAKQQLLDAFEEAVSHPLDTARRRAAVTGAAVALMVLATGLLITALLTWLSKELSVPVAFLIVGAAVFAAAAILFAISGRKTERGRGSDTKTGDEGAASGVGQPDKTESDRGTFTREDPP